MGLRKILSDEKLEASLLNVEVYPKAQILNRLIAKLIDAIVVLAIAKLLVPVGWLAGLAYVLIADGFSGGQSIGKRLIGLQTIALPTREAAGFKESIIRNLPLALAYLLFPIPYVGWLAAFAILALESLLIVGNDQGLRLGDEIARTQVLDSGQLDVRE